MNKKIVCDFCIGGRFSIPSFPKKNTGYGPQADVAIIFDYINS